MNKISLSDRISGSLFGLLLCDSLGTAVECQTAGSFDPVKSLRGGGKFQLKPGQFTDDGSMALCLSIALLDNENNIHSSIKQMNLYRRWYENGYLSSNGECFDIGITVRIALNKFISNSDQSETAYYGNTSDKASGNGSLMRLAPIALLYYQDPSHAVTEAMNSSKTTHASILCLDSCRIYTVLIIGALQGFSKDDLLNTDQVFVPNGLPNDYWINNPLDADVFKVINGSYKQLNPPEIKASGFVIETMEAALWAFYHTNSFEEGALKAVNLGNDADTVGAIYGMLAGAFYGIDSIPNEWKEKCYFNDLVQTISDELFRQSQIRTNVSVVYKKLLEVYDDLAKFYSGTIKRRVLPCPKQYKSMVEFNEDIQQLHSIYESVLKPLDEDQEMITNEEKQLIFNRSKTILKQFLILIEDDKHSLTIKWLRNVNPFSQKK
ncbi:unnamed protein product [Adineta steineri]|uniref:ADP-ribosylglycohydrolase n=2 Tax=Adineta steineri TaxID=433720 RepID=A0A819ALL5_9BILA|nr:unnamed protein product [Adineta steineri]